jgi:hypothetical protein
MIILRVAMGRAWLKGTVNEVSSSLAFAAPATVHEQSQGVCPMIFNPEGSVSGSGTFSNRSETFVRKHMSAAGGMSC